MDRIKGLRRKFAEIKTELTKLPGPVRLQILENFFIQSVLICAPSLLRFPTYTNTKGSPMTRAPPSFASLSSYHQAITTTITTTPSFKAVLSLSILLAPLRPSTMPYPTPSAATS